jgi:hypothetical protein
MKSPTGRLTESQPSFQNISVPKTAMGREVTEMFNFHVQAMTAAYDALERFLASRTKRSATE